MEHEIVITWHGDSVAYCLDDHEYAALVNWALANNEQLPGAICRALFEGLRGLKTKPTNQPR